jgi:hypothetical protein
MNDTLIVPVHALRDDLLRGWAIVPIAVLTPATVLLPEGARDRGCDRRLSVLERPRARRVPPAWA